MSVKYHNELFNYIDLPVQCIHVRTYHYSLAPMNVLKNNLLLSSCHFEELPKLRALSEILDLSGRAEAKA